MVITAGLAGYAVHRYRLKHVLAVERIRTRIAGDLHDDIGSGLSQIAILSEVMKQEARGEEPQDQLEHVAELARGLVDSMSEIVWSISPNRDHLIELVQRMRQLASDVLPTAKIGFEFKAPPAQQDLGLPTDVRRQVFLIFKEAVNNIVRHAGCTHVSIELTVEQQELVLKLSDNGRGFDVTNGNAGNGHGLMSMERRSAELGGHLQVTSQLGGGTRIVLRVPKCGVQAALASR
jgi:signal transduction histidine kinase